MRIASSLYKTSLLAGLLVLLCSIAGVSNVAAQSGSVAGLVIDAQTDDPLPGANIRIAGTSLGTATDAEGRYRLSGVPTGRQTVQFSYVGYQSSDTTVAISAGATTSVTMVMDLAVVEGEELVVTAQLAGQQRAINQQLSSNKIVEIVSSDRIEELPEANAAEAVGRLTGVSLQRDAGEGQKVVVRGLSPSQTSVTLDGERIPSTDGENRSVDLSMIAPEMLGGIELFKALTPDQDADAIGGTVNLRLKEAPAGFRGRVKAQAGYNDLQSTVGPVEGPYKVSTVMSDRFLEGRLGVMVTGNVERANRSAEELAGDYDYVAGDDQRGGEFSTLNANISDIIEERQRYGGSTAMDYQLENGHFKLRGLVSSTERDQLRRRVRYRVDKGRVERDLRDRTLRKTLYSGAFSGEHAFQHIELDYATSYSLTRQRQPDGFFHRFRELAAFEGAPEGTNLSDLPPAQIPGFASNDLENTYYDFTQQESERGHDRDLTSSINGKVPFRLGTGASGFLKFGFKFRDKARERDQTTLQTPDDAVNAVAAEEGWSVGGVGSPAEGAPLFENFVDTSFEADDFLSGRLSFGPGLSASVLNDFARRRSDLFAVNRLESDLEDYAAGERVLANYLMAEINLGERLMILPGYRLEQTATDYLSYTGEYVTGDVNRDREFEERGLLSIRDTTGSSSYYNLLPMLHARYRFSDAVQVRGAVTRSIARPDYFDLVFYENLNFIDATAFRGNPDLRPTKAWNADLFASVYNRFGLLTAGVFYKQLTDPIYDTLIPEEISRPGIATQTYLVEQAVNGEDAEVYGFEIGLQANLTFLPGLLSGFVANVNYAYTESQTFFPETLINRLPDGRQDPDNPFRTVQREGKLPDQKPHVLNASLGYERAGFTARVSMSHQSAYTSEIGVNRESSFTRRAFTFWDATVSQELPGRLRRAEVFFNVNNITEELEREYINRGTAYESENELFGWTTDLGVKYSF